MLQLSFNSISEATPGDKWQKLFNTHWPAYKAWFESKGVMHKPNLEVSRKRLNEHMPEMINTYDKLCELAGNDQTAWRFLTGYKPPAYITGCSQAIWTKKPQLVRNYDYHPHLSEGTVLHSAWNGKQVMGTGDCLWGLVDGINEDGLVASLTFGGRKIVDMGFGIPFIIRYVLEVCSDVNEAVEVLKRVPSHMAYNVSVLDKTGSYKTVQLAPDHKARVTDMRVATNHQGQIDWPEHAAFSKTLEREKHIEELLKKTGQDAEGVAEAFLQSPLFNTRYTDGFGTVYTAVYRPEEGVMELRWPENRLKQSLSDFKESVVTIAYHEKVPSYTGPAEVPAMADADADYWIEYGKAWASGEPTKLARYVAQTITDSLGMAGVQSVENLVEQFTSETKRRGQIPWEMLADVWSNLGGNHEHYSKRYEDE